MTVPCTDAAASDLDKVRADIASIEVELAATGSQLTKALDALGAWQRSLALPLSQKCRRAWQRAGSNPAHRTGRINMMSIRKATAGPDRPDQPKRVPVFTSNGVIHVIDAVLLSK